MRHILVLLALAMSIGAAAAADMRVSHQDAGARPEIWRYNKHSNLLPFPRTKRSQAVYADTACWSGCQSFCTWNEAACLQVDAQGRCLRVTDTCDRSCQRECRSRGGPYVAFDFLIGD